MDHDCPARGTGVAHAWVFRGMHAGGYTWGGVHGWMMHAWVFLASRNGGTHMHVFRWLYWRNPLGFISAKSVIATFFQGSDEPLYEAWERLKSLLRRFPNHSFDDAAQLPIFYSGLKPHTKMILDASARGTMMSKSPKEAIVIIDSIAASDYQSHHDRAPVQRKDGVVFEVFPRRGSFGRKTHACSTQTASGTGKFGLREEIASANGDISASANGEFQVLYMMNSVITVLYFNGRVYEDNDGVIFEGSKKAIQIKRGISFSALKKKIGDKVKLQNNEIIFAISCRFLVSGKYIALQICDEEDVETMLESFKQQQQISVLELYIEKDVVGGSMFHSANSLTSCGNYLSNDETQLPTNMSNLHVDKDDDDDDDYLVSNSYVEEFLDEDDSVDGISDTDNEVTDMIQPVKIVHPAKGVQVIHNPFWNDALHYKNINWSHPDEEDICGLEMPSSFNVGQELYVGMDFDSKDAVKNAVKQYVMKVHQSFKVVESKWDKYVVCCLNKNADCPCPFYMRAILSKKNDSWKVTQWGGPHTCLNMTMTQDHEKLDSDLIATCVVGTYFMFILCYCLALIVI
ncbi:hypothetical protein HKD37_02G004832 [Glycine soja]